MTCKFISFNSFLLYLNVVFVLSTSGYVLITTKYAAYIYFMSFVLGLVTFLYFFFTFRAVQKEKLYLIASFFIVLYIFSSLSAFFNASEENFITNIKFLLILFFVFSFCLFYNVDSICSAYSNSILIVCIISLIFYTFVNFFGVSFNLPIVLNSNDVGYSLGFIFFYYDSFLSFRNIGIFWEPGIFSTMIFTALVLDVYVNKIQSSFRRIVFITSIVTTFSSAGVILLVLYFLLLFAHSGFNVNYKSLLSFFIVCFTLFFSGYFMLDVINSIGIDPLRVFDKILAFSENESQRLESPLINIQLFIEKPLFGWGLIDGLRKYESLSQIAMTSTSTFYLMSYGVFGVVYSVIPIFFILSLKSISITEKNLLLVSYFFILNKEPHFFFSIDYVFLVFMVLFLYQKFFSGKNSDKSYI